MSPVGSFWVVSHVQVGPAIYWRLVLEGHRRVQDLSWGHLKLLLNFIIFNSNSSNFLLPLLWRHLYFWYVPCLLLGTLLGQESLRWALEIAYQHDFSSKYVSPWPLLSLVLMVLIKDHWIPLKMVKHDFEGFSYHIWQHMLASCMPRLSGADFKLLGRYVSCFVIFWYGGFLASSKLMLYMVPRGWT